MKYGIYLLIALSITGAIAGAHNYVFEQGRKAERAELQEAYTKALTQQYDDYQQQVNHALATQANDYADELTRLADNQQTEVITQEIIRYVEKEIIVPGECVSLAGDIVGVLQQTTGIIAAAARTTESADQPGPVKVLPSSADGKNHNATDTGTTAAGINDTNQERRDDSRLLPPSSKPG